MDRMGHIRRFRQRAGSLAIFLSVLLLALPGTAQATAGWQTYTHPQLGFSLSYPDGWAETNGPSGVAFMALGPAAAGGQSFRLNVNVTSEELPSGMNVEDYEAQNESGLGLLFTGYRRLRTDRLLIGSYPAVVRYYTWKRGDCLDPDRSFHLVPGYAAGRSSNLFDVVERGDAQPPARGDLAREDHRSQQCRHRHQRLHRHGGLQNRKPADRQAGGQCLPPRSAGARRPSPR